MGQCATGPGSRAYYYAELANSSLVVAITTASIHYTYPWKDGQAGKMPSSVRITWKPEYAGPPRLFSLPHWAHVAAANLGTDGPHA